MPNTPKTMIRVLSEEVGIDFELMPVPTVYFIIFTKKYKMKPSPRIIAISLIITYISLLFFCCLHHFSGSEKLDLYKHFLGIRLDRYAHFTMFFPYPFISWFLLNYDKKISGWSRYTFSIIFISGLFLATLAEVSQEFLTSYRDTDPFDLVANFVGITAGTILIFILDKPFKKILNHLFRV